MDHDTFPPEPPPEPPAEIVARQRMKKMYAGGAVVLFALMLMGAAYLVR